MSKRRRDPSLPPITVGGLKIYRRLLAYARPHWPMFLLGGFGMALFAAVDTGLAWLVKEFLDGAFVERDERVLVLVPAGIIVLFLARGVGDYLCVFAPGWVGRQVIKSLRGQVFRHSLYLPVPSMPRSGSLRAVAALAAAGLWAQAGDAANESPRDADQCVVPRQAESARRPAPRHTAASAHTARAAGSVAE